MFLFKLHTYLLRWSHTRDYGRRSRSSQLCSSKVWWRRDYAACTALQTWLAAPAHPHTIQGWPPFLNEKSGRMPENRPLSMDRYDCDSRSLPHRQQWILKKKASTVYTSHPTPWELLNTYWRVVSDSIKTRCFNIISNLGPKIADKYINALSNW